MTSDSERRHFSRVRFHTNATVTHGDQSWECELLDVSLKGLLLEEPEGFEADDQQPLQATIPLSDTAEIEMTVSVARREHGRVGLVCENIDVESIAHLRRLVELNLGEPNAAERELSELLAHYEQHAES